MLVVAHLRNTEGSDARPIQFPLDEFTDEYESNIGTLYESSQSGVGMFSHPPMTLWKGGQMHPVSLSFKLAAGVVQESEDDYTVPHVHTAAMLIDFMEQMYSLAVPDPKVRIPEGNPFPPQCELRVFSIEGGVNSAWYLRRGYVTKISCKFRHPWDLTTGMPMVVEGTLTFTLAPQKAIGDIKKAEINWKALPHRPWKFNSVGVAGESVVRAKSKASKLKITPGRPLSAQMVGPPIYLW